MLEHFPQTKPSLPTWYFHFRTRNEPLNVHHLCWVAQPQGHSRRQIILSHPTVLDIAVVPIPKLSILVEPDRFQWCIEVLILIGYWHGVVWTRMPPNPPVQSTASSFVSFQKHAMLIHVIPHFQTDKHSYGWSSMALSLLEHLSNLIKTILNPIWTSHTHMENWQLPWAPLPLHLPQVWRSL